MRVSVSITKTVQERQYEPFSITLFEEVEVEADAATARARIYTRLEKEVDKLIAARLADAQEPSIY